MGQSKTAEFSKIFNFLIVEVINLAKNHVLGKKNVNFSKLYVRHFPREFANSMTQSWALAIFFQVC